MSEPASNSEPRPRGYWRVLGEAVVDLLGPSESRREPLRAADTPSGPVTVVDPKKRVRARRIIAAWVLFWLGLLPALPSLALVVWAVGGDAPNVSGIDFVIPIIFAVGLFGAALVVCGRLQQALLPYFNRWLVKTMGTERSS